LIETIDKTPALERNQEMKSEEMFLGSASASGRPIDERIELGGEPARL